MDLSEGKKAELIERVARAISSARGENPDRMVTGFIHERIAEGKTALVEHKPYANWTRYVVEARAVTHEMGVAKEIS